MVLVSLSVKAKVLSTAHKDLHDLPHHLPPSSVATPNHLAPAALGSSLLLEHFRHVSTSGPLHLQCPIPGMLFSIHFLIFKTLHQCPLAPYLQFQHFSHFVSSFFYLDFFLCSCHFPTNYVFYFIFLPVSSTR